MTVASESTFDRDWVISRAGRVGVLMGGKSAEREISLKSGHQVYAALLANGIDAVEIDWCDDFQANLGDINFDRVFIALHGRGGEDGHVQGMLAMLGVPYTGSGLLGSALAMDKVRCKQVWMSCGLPTPEFAVVTQKNCEVTPPNFTYPVMVKPAREGSSIGITKVKAASELKKAISLALSFDDTVIIEQWIDGPEYTLSILNGHVLPIIKLETPHEFYDYEAKYVADTTRYLCPCGMDENIQRICNDVGLRAFEACGASGWGRVDFMLSEDQGPQLIEVNTVPGMTDHSLVPMAAAAAGIEFNELVLRILSTSFEATQ